MSMKIDESFLTKYSSNDLYKSDKYYFEGLPYIRTYIIEKDYFEIASQTCKRTQR